ncbi:MAG: hypothetical protein QXU44_04095 [Candidatus Caldarchaeum sp.]
MKSSLSALLATSVGLIVLLLFPFPVYASKELRFNLVDGFGTSRYRLILEMPDELLMNEEMKVGFVLYLDDLPPLKHYTGYLTLTFTLVSEDGQTLTRTSISNRMEAYKVDYIYPGHRWGPYVLTLKPDYSRLHGGASVSVYVVLDVEEYVEDQLGVPVIPTKPSPETVFAGSIRVSQPLPIFETGLAGFAILVLAVVYLYTKRARKPPR